MLVAETCHTNNSSSARCRYPICMEGEDESSLSRQDHDMTGAHSHPSGSQHLVSKPSSPGRLLPQYPPGSPKVAGIQRSHRSPSSPDTPPASKTTRVLSPQVRPSPLRAAMAGVLAVAAMVVSPFRSAGRNGDTTIVTVPFMLLCLFCVGSCFPFLHEKEL